MWRGRRTAEGKTIFQVAGSFDHTVVLCSDGTLLSWGEGFYGALGYGSLTTRNQPGLVDQTGVLAGKRVVSIAAAVGIRWSFAPMAHWRAGVKTAKARSATAQRRNVAAQCS
jgi:alpha-tubulin suppressor-like RCC1 family protein